MTSLPGYQIRKELGRGGGGIVYLGVRNKDNLTVAIKKLDKQEQRRPPQDETPTEITFLERVQNIPGIIKMIDHFNYFGVNYLIMEKFGSSDLFNWICLKGGSDEHTAKIIFSQVVKIVDKCFNQGIVHGDIKDENILINPNTLEIRIIDFGEGMFVENKTYQKFHGTLTHSPPEWFQNKEFTQEPWTIWSLGILLFTLICGDYPFEEGEVTQVNPFLNPLWKELEGKSRDLQQLVNQCLAFNPCERITLSQVLQSPWLQNMHQ